MSSNGQRPGRDGSEGDGKTPSPEIHVRNVPNPLTPEQSCLGCMLGLLALLLAIAFWAYYFWRMGQQ